MFFLDSGIYAGIYVGNFMLGIYVVGIYAAIKEVPSKKQEARSGKREAGSKKDSFNNFKRVSPKTMVK
jgi:hypothetical protein